MTTVTSLLVTDNFNFVPSVRPYTNAVTADGQLIIGSTAAPHLKVNTLTAGSGINIVNGSGSITISSTAPSFTLIQSINTTSGSTVTFNDPTIVNYNELLFVFSNVTTFAQGADEMSMAFSNDGGATYAINFYGVGERTAYNSNPFYIAASNTVPTLGMFGFISLLNQNSTILRPFETSLTVSDGVTPVTFSYTGITQSSTQLNAFQISWLTGPFVTGNISLYGK